MALREFEYNFFFVGVCEVNLSYNKIESDSMIDLCQFLKYDTWTRVKIN